MSKDLISVIITTFKRSDRLELAIKSVIQQTFKNIEIIVVDDNANNAFDRSQTKKLENKYKNVIFIYNDKNLGGALSRNVGIKKASGQIISFLDDDDQYLDNRLELMYNIFKNNESKKIGLVYCNYYSINIKNEIISSYENNAEGLPLYDQMIHCIAPTSMWLASKKALINIGLFEDTPCKQDSIVLLKLIANGYMIFPAKEKLVYYLEHENDRISGYKLSNIVGLKNYRNWCRRYYNLLNNKKREKNVEATFSSQLITLYIINNLKKEARKELVILFRNAGFSKKFYKSLFKILFSSYYLKKIGIKEKKSMRETIKKIYNVIYYQLSKFRNYKILNNIETISEIVDKKKSVSRFGDGEFKWALGIKQNSFQDDDPLLQQKLLAVLNAESNDKVLICIPYGLKSTREYSKKTANFWHSFVRWYGKKIKKILNKKNVYGDTNFTRWYLESNKKDIDYFKNIINKIKKIWNNRDVVIVEGYGTKIGVNNDFISNAKSISRVLAPSVNAFSYYDEIFDYICDNISQDKLLLLALGPTATVLAYELSMKGYQAIDVGHVDIEYEWYKMKATNKCAVKGKSVNEAGTVENKIDYSDKEYIKSIIKIIGDTSENKKSNI